MTPYDGEERRHDVTNVRIAILETHFIELKESQNAIHARITDFKSEIKEDMRIGFQDIKEQLSEFSTATEAKASISSDKFDHRITLLESWRQWLTGAYIALSIIIGAWLSHKGKG